MVNCTCTLQNTTKTWKYIPWPQKGGNGLQNDPHWFIGVAHFSLLMNTAGHVKIADFGIATNTNTVGKSTFVGTTTYMSVCARHAMLSSFLSPFSRSTHSLLENSQAFKQLSHA